MHIGVQDAVGVLVEDDGLVEFTGAIESHEGKLALPAAKELTCDFVALFPEDWRESLQALLVDGNDEQGCAGVEDRVLEESGEDGTHLLELFGDIAAIFFRAVGNDTEVRALNFAPRLSGGSRGKQQREGTEHAGQQTVRRNETLVHQSIVGRGGERVKGKAQKRGFGVALSVARRR